MGNDLISRQETIDAIVEWTVEDRPDIEMPTDLVGRINALPSTQPEPQPIGYADCANAMLKMWMDGVVTDGEYNRIMDKLNAHEKERRTDEQAD